MPNMNLNNNGSLTGRLASDPKFYQNKNGSQTVQFVLLVDRDYVDRDGNRPVDGIPLEAYIADPSKGLGPYAHIHAGDLISVAYELRTDVFTPAGASSPTYKLKVEIKGIDFREPRSVTEARRTKRLNEQAQQTMQRQPAAPVAQAAPVATPMGLVQTQTADGEVKLDAVPVFGA